MNFPIPEFLRKKINELISAEGPEEEFVDEISQEELEQLPVYRTLKESIKEGMTLDEMIDAFAAMSRIPVGDPDDLLFETGTYNFTGKKLFYFSMTRQFQYRNEDEYVQLHLDVRYAPSPATARLQCTEWASLTEGDFFRMVRSSEAYQTVKDAPITEVSVYIEET